MEYIFTTDAIPEPGRELSRRNEFLRVFEAAVQAVSSRTAQYTPMAI